MQKLGPELLSSTPRSVDQREIARKKREFLKVTGRLKPDARGVISDLASTLLEEDQYNKYRNDPQRRRSLQTDLSSMGLDIDGIATVMNFFNLPIVEEPNNQ